MAGFHTSLHLPFFVKREKACQRRLLLRPISVSLFSISPPTSKETSLTWAHVRLLKHPQQRLLRVHEDQAFRGRLDHFRARPSPKRADASGLVDLADGLDGPDVPVSAQVRLPNLRERDRFVHFFVLKSSVGRGVEGRTRRSRFKKKKNKGGNADDKTFALVLCIPTPCAVPFSPSLPREASPAKPPRSIGAQDRERRSATRERPPIPPRRRRRFGFASDKQEGSHQLCCVERASSSPSRFHYENRKTRPRASPTAGAGSSRPGAFGRRVKEREERRRKKKKRERERKNSN